MLSHLQPPAAVSKVVPQRAPFIAGRSPLLLLSFFCTFFYHRGVQRGSSARLLPPRTLIPGSAPPGNEARTPIRSNLQPPAVSIGTGTIAGRSPILPPPCLLIVVTTREGMIAPPRPRELALSLYLPHVLQLSAALPPAAEQVSSQLVVAQILARRVPRQ